MRYVRGHRRPYASHELKPGPWHRALGSSTSCSVALVSLPNRGEVERDTWPDEGKRCAECLKAAS